MAREHRETVDIEKFRVRHGEAVLAETSQDVVGYGADGLPVMDVNSPECLCKAVKDTETKGTQWFVKFCMAGINSGNMVDPNEETDMRRRGDWTANGHFCFRPVSQLAYDLYVKFIQTGNQAWLRQAAREVER